MHRWWATMPKPAWVAGCAVPCVKRTWRSASQCAERLVGHMPWWERPGVYSAEDAGGTLAVRKETAAHLLKSLEELPPERGEITRALRVLGYDEDSHVAETVYRVFESERANTGQAMSSGLSSLVDGARRERGRQRGREPPPREPPPPPRRAGSWMEQCTANVRDCFGDEPQPEPQQQAISPPQGLINGPGTRLGVGAPLGVTLGTARSVML